MKGNLILAYPLAAHHFVAVGKEKSLHGQEAYRKASGTRAHPHGGGMKGREGPGAALLFGEKRRTPKRLISRWEKDYHHPWLIRKKPTPPPGPVR